MNRFASAVQQVFHKLFIAAALQGAHEAFLIGWAFIILRVEEDFEYVAGLVRVIDFKNLSVRKNWLAVALQEEDGVPGIAGVCYCGGLLFKVNANRVSTDAGYLQILHFLRKTFTDHCCTWNVKTVLGIILKSELHTRISLVMKQLGQILFLSAVA